MLMDQIYAFLGDDFDVMLLRILLATLLCGMIGFERELKKHSAGFRTHILVGVGACLMMLLSIYGFEAYIMQYDNIRFDPARIPSYVISGIGFLGAGTIMVHGMTIRGLTTAASIWTVAGIGLVVGAGLYPLAILATLVVLISLIVLNSWEKVIGINKSENMIQIIVNQDANLGDILKVFDDFSSIITRLEINNESKYQRKIFVKLKEDQNESMNELLVKLNEIEHVMNIYKR
mgnify:FL=1